MADKKYSVDDILKIFSKLEKKINEISCFVKECCAKIPVNIGSGAKLYKRFSQNKWEFKSILAGSNISIVENNNEIVISSTASPSLYCDDVKDCIGIDPTGDPDKYLNEQGDFITISSSGFTCSDLSICSTTNLSEGANLYFTNGRAISALTGQNVSLFTNDSGYITSSALSPYLTIASAAITYQPIGSYLTTISGLNISLLTNDSGYITSAALSPYLTSATAAATYYPIANPSGYISGITGLMVTTALGYTPYDSANPSGYITSAALSPYLTIATAAATYQPIGSYLTAAITTLNGLTPATQTFATGTSGTDFNISSATSAHTFNIPTASATNRGLLSTSDWSTFDGKQNALSGTGIVKSTAGTISYITDNSSNWDTAYTNRITSLTTTGSSGAATLASNTLNIPNYTLAGLGGVPTSTTLTINGVTYDLSANRSWTVSGSSDLVGKDTTQNTLTGTGTETIMASIQIAANTFAVGDGMKIETVLSKSAQTANDTWIVKVYLNDTNDLTTPVQILTSGTQGNTIRTLGITRGSCLFTANTTMTSAVTTSSLHDDLAGNSNLAYDSTTVPNITSTMYLIVTAQHNGASQADIIQHRKTVLYKQ